MFLSYDGNFWMYLDLKTAEVGWGHGELSPAERGL